MIGNVRVLPPGAPNVPPSIPYDGCYDDSLACMSAVWAADSPEVMTLVGDVTQGVYCTRPDQHPEDEVHCCHLRHEETGEPQAVVVWGGE